MGATRLCVTGAACALLGWAAVTGFRAAETRTSGLAYVLVDIDRAGFEQVETLKGTEGVRWWVEADDKLLMLADPKITTKIDRPSEVLAIKPRLDRLLVVRRAHDGALESMNAELIVRAGRSALVQTESPLPDLALEDHEAGEVHRHEKVQLFRPNAVFARQVANAPQPRSVTFDPEIERLVAAVDGHRWLADVETLAGWNRYTHGSQIAAARQWLYDRFAELPGLEVSLMPFRVGSTTAYNVVAILHGTTRPDDWYLIGGHYDSTSQTPSRAAPGAEDNATGAAGVLEMARVFTENPPEATMIFVAYAGEEQGLHGSVAHARSIVEAGDTGKLKAAIIMDMIGYTRDSDLDCLLETNRIGSFLFDHLQAAASRFTRLRLVTTLNPWGSDHVPYLDRGMPALLTIENDWNEYPQYHRTGDLPSNVTLEMGEEILKMNVAAIGQMARSAW